MNYKRILLGALVGGLIMNVGDALVNIFILAGSDLSADLVRHNLTIARWAPPVLLLGPFATSLALMLIYAGIRPHFGPGLATALRAAAVVWVLGWLLPTFTLLIIGLGSPATHAISVAWGAGEAILTSVVMGLIYREPALVLPGSALAT